MIICGILGNLLVGHIYPTGVEVLSSLEEQ
jgi:hypothetical protein